MKKFLKQLLLVTLVILSGCSFFDDPNSVEIKRLGSPCSFLNLSAGVCLNSVMGDDGQTCMPPAGFEQTEVSCDGLDNDCDGVADANCPCNVNDVAIGACGRGVVQSDGVCLPPVDFDEENDICGDEVDNNCDGSIDEGCVCEFNLVDTCESQVGEEGACAQPASYEMVELTCDGIDNDCDGEVDENLMQACEKTEGACAGAMSQCGNGMFVTCDDAVYAERSWYEADETLCDGKDNDCDGAIDESCPCNYRDLANGECMGLTRDATGTCPEPGTFNEQELCDGLDNNCDGAVDEGCNCTAGATQTCGSSVGECVQGLQTCVNDFWSQCVGATGPVPETCNGADDNCDGTIDEFLIQACDNQQGVCVGSTVSCTGGSFAECAAIQFSANNVNYQGTEVLCDGFDNDCDGIVDEMCACGYNGTSVGVCGTAVISSGTGMCEQPMLYQANETACDGRDNDCDGGIDEGCPCNYNGSTKGVCPEGVLNAGGNCTAPAEYLAIDDNCDGVDNDCDGIADDDAQASESFCGDRKDNDCDGAIDCEDEDCRDQICGVDDDIVIVQPKGVSQSALEQLPAPRRCGADGSCR